MEHAPICPRCDYDLSGIAESWRDSCPLDGTCSECGLNVRWAEVLNPSLTVPQWSFEHALPALAAHRLLATWRRALSPARFWRDLRLEHEVAPRRLALLLVLFLMSTHILAYSATVWLRYRWGLGARVWGGAVPTLPEVAWESVWPYSFADVTGFDGWNIVGVPHWLTLVWAALTPLSFLVLIDTLRQVRVRRVHLFRAGVYAMAPMPVFMAAHAACRLYDGLTLASIAQYAPAVVWLLGVAWFVWYWWLVPRRYLRLPHASAVTIVMLGVSGLAAIVLMVLLAIVGMRSM